MTKPNKYQNFDIKSNKKRSNYIEEDNVSFREVKRDKMQKHYRNFDNALRSKNLDRLISYDEEQ
jgi:hypothetical protein